MMNGANGGGVQGSSWRRRVHSFLPTARGLRYSLLHLEHRSTVHSHSAQCIRRNLKYAAPTLCAASNARCYRRGR
jgi:hypothetical protein